MVHVEEYVQTYMCTVYTYQLSSSLVISSEDKGSTSFPGFGGVVGGRGGGRRSGTMVVCTQCAVNCVC